MLTSPRGIYTDKIKLTNILRKERDNFGYSYGVTLSEDVCNSILSRTIFNELLSRSFPIARFVANRR